jgi:glycosyltransferase involved in cell wall biosynthesis
MKGGIVLHTQKVAGISGSEAHLLQLLPDLRERGWDVRFLMLHEEEPGAWEFAEALRARGVPLDEIRLRADVDPIAFGEVTGYLARVRPRILHTHLVHADVYGQLAGSVARVPFRLSTKHGFNEFREGRWFGFADRSVGSLAHVHIAISQGLAHYLAETEGFDEAAFEIVHYGIASAGDAKPYEDAEPRLLCIGRLIPIKGHLVLLRALAQARARVPGLVLDVAGRGPLEPALKAYARELGLEDAVRFLGFVSPVQKAIEDAAIVVVPSLGEGFGMVALEAMERARPVIVSTVGGLPEIVEDGETGLVVPPADAEALADAIAALAENLPRAAEMGRAARERALSAFTPERCVERVEALYARALEPAPT